jgi:sugar phosphate isomerase/epimerase
VRQDFYRTLWGASEPLALIAAQAAEAGFTGVEGALPVDPAEREQFCATLAEHGLSLIGEICTGGSADDYWVPRRDADVDEHLRTLDAALAAYVDAPVAVPLVNCMGGLDAWDLDECLRFFDGSLELAERHGVKLVFETHRTRCLYSPWSTLRILRARPHLRLTCDFSHWVVVAERLIDTEAEALDMAIARAEHIHCRVGYPQGPQVPHPAAPEYAKCLAAHQGWWQRIWQSRLYRGCAVTTMNPEFGPDGYLHTLPFTNAPVADLWQIAQWMAMTERARFQQFLQSAGA